MADYFDPRRRIPVTLRGSLQASEGTLLEVRLRNLSLRGAMIAHRDQLVPGQPYVLSLALGEVNLHVQARVVWSKASSAPSDPTAGEDVRFLSGLHFVPLPEPIEIHFRQYLVTIAKSHPSRELN